METEKKQDLLNQVREALTEIRPHLEEDGGDIEVLDITDDFTVDIKWLGTCKSCAMSAMTMKAGVEQAIKNHVPEIESIRPVNGVNAQ